MHSCIGRGSPASGGLDEHAIHELVQSGVPADAFGVGTSLDVSADAPGLDMAYNFRPTPVCRAGSARPGKRLGPG